MKNTIKESINENTLTFEKTNKKDKSLRGLIKKKM